MEETWDGIGWGGKKWSGEEGRGGVVKLSFKFSKNLGGAG